MGKKNFTVKRINLIDYQDEMLEVTKLPYSSWPENIDLSLRKNNSNRG